jgi:hypothetical protein
MQQVRPIYKKARERREVNPALVVLLSVLGVLVLSYLVISVYFFGRFRPGTWIGDYYATGATPEEVNGWLKAVTPVPSILVTDADGNEMKVPITGIQYKYDYTEELEHLLDRQMPFTWVAGLFGETRFTPEGTLELEEEELRPIFNGIPAVQASASGDAVYRIDYSPENGYVLYNGKTTDFRAEDAFADFAESVKKRQDTFDLSLYYSSLSLTEEEQQLHNLWSRLDWYLNCDLVYDMGAEQIPMDRVRMASFLKKDMENLPVTALDGSFVLDDEAVEGFIRELCDSYNTYGHRMFRTTRGDEVEVNGGTYGTLLDSETELAFLKNALMRDTFHDGTEDLHIPEYKMQGVVRGLDDIGPSYVEVDLLEQKLYFYLEGELFLSSDIVSGNAARKNNTPEGTDYIYYMQKDRYLRGKDYVSFVHYWMAFIEHVGLHDASWRSEFGGEIYKTSGSHGCVNLPSDVAKTLYENVWVGMPVIVHN